MENEEEEASKNLQDPSLLLEHDSVTALCDTKEELQNSEPQCDSVPELDESQHVHGENESPQPSHQPPESTPPTVVVEVVEDVISGDVNQVIDGGGESPPQPPQSPPQPVAEKVGDDMIAREENQAIEVGNGSPAPPLKVEGGDESLPPPPTVFQKDGDDVIAGEEEEVVVGIGESSLSLVSSVENEEVKAGEERTEGQAVDGEMATEKALDLVAEDTTTAVTEEAETEVTAVADTVTEDTLVTNASNDMMVAEAVEDVETTENTVISYMVDASENREVADMAEDVAEISKETEMAELADDTLEAAEAAEERDIAGQTEVAETAEREVFHMEEEMEMPELAEEADVAEAVYETDMAEMGEETDVTEMAEEAEMDVAEETEMVEETEVAEEASRSGGGKRKRGKSSKAPARAPVRKTIEEDVCFICFDGGELVLCDRRGCPKAYHPSCVNRDEAFFRAKGRWNCGWHLCSNCEKNASYMCYTCTFSLCKGCLKDAVIFCVRGNKGFCETCMKTVMLIERNEQGNKEMPQVDFDDKSSWEYLFKDYWIDLKGRLSLTLDELARAKNPWKGYDVLVDKHESAVDHSLTNNDGVLDSDSSSGNAGARISRRRKIRKHDSNKDVGLGLDSYRNAEAKISRRRQGKRQLKSLAKDGNSRSTATIVGAEGSSKADCVEWGSKELLEFVMHMKDGDKSVLSQFDVQALLLEYIKRNKLRDPRRKSQIICDSRLENLFGKPRVGHFEMLKLLESHFPIKDDFQADDLQMSVVDTEVNPPEADGNPDALVKVGKDKKRKTRKKGDGRGSQSNLDDYAAVDMHNINLIYLRRSLVEDLIEDTEGFHDKVVGSFVRIRISGSGQKQDLYRLVQVVGTSTAAEPYKVGKRMTSVMLEILNLNKTEVISIDIISNQEFTEDECKRLRQSIKCGLINRMTVGDLQEKAMALQAVRVKDLLEAEILRFSHLRDRASDLGRRKQLRECVEKLQLLKAPEERQRRLEEMQEIHADPKMDPSYESEDDEDETDIKKQENYMRPRGTGLSRKVTEPISPRKGAYVSNDAWGGSRALSSMNRELSRNMSNRSFLHKGDDATGTAELGVGNSWNQGKDRETQQSYSREKPKTALSSETGTRNSHSSLIPESSSGVVSETLPAPLGAMVEPTAAKINETEKIWHYQDPSGKVQGPFSVVQLRKWNNTGYFPTNLRIWKTDEKQDDSMLLADVLTGNLKREPLLMDNSFPKDQIGQTPNLTSSYSGKPYGTPLQRGQESQSAGVSWRLETEISSPKSRATPSVDIPKYSSDGWNGNYGSRNDYINLPSPTPSQTPAGGTREQGYENKRLSNPFSVQPQGLGNGSLQSHVSVIPESGQLTRSSTLPSPIKPSGGFDGSNVANATFGQPGNKEQNRMKYLGIPSSSNSGGQLVQGSENDHSGSLLGVSQAPGTGRGVLPSLMTVSGESQRLQGNGHLLLASDLTTASMTPGADIIKNSGASLQNSVVFVSNHNPPADTQGWRSGSVPKPETIASHQIPRSDSQVWGGTPPQKTDSNNPNPMPAQSPAYGHRGDTPSSVPNSASSFAAGNPTGIFPTQGFTGLPPSDPWRPPVLANQSNIQPSAPPNHPWGVGVTDNSNAAQRPVAENQNAGWGLMPGNPNMGWRGPAPGNANMNWGASGQGAVPGNVSTSWTAPGQGSVPGNPNTGWAAPNQGPMPGPATPGQGPLPGNANPAWVAPQGPPPGNTNPSWVANTPNPGMWGSEQNQRDRSSQGGDSGYGGGRQWNRQQSFGSGGGSSRPPFKGQRVCKFFRENGHCKKGASCDYLHN